MSRTRWNKHRYEFPNFINVFDEIFNDVTNVVGSDFIKSSPAVNIIESDTAFKLELAAPGLLKEDFDINVHEDTLIISSKKDINIDESKEKYNRKEFNYSSFRRKFDLPNTVDPNNIKATYNLGILVLTLAKKEEEIKRPKIINID